MAEAAFFRDACVEAGANFTCFSCRLMSAAVAALVAFFCVCFTAGFDLVVAALVRADRTAVRAVLGETASLSLLRLAAVPVLAALVLRLTDAAARASVLRLAVALAVFFFAAALFVAEVFATEVFATEVLAADAVLAFCLLTVGFAAGFEREGREAVIERAGFELRCFGDFASGTAALVLREGTVFLTEGIRGALLFGPALETGRSGNGRERPVPLMDPNISLSA